MRKSPNFEVLKEPRGFIKVLQIFIAIFAFATCTGYRGSGELTIYCKTSALTYTRPISFDYPFEEGSVKMTFEKCGTKTFPPYTFDVDYKGSAQYYVVVGVFCFLYCLGMMVYYILFEEDTNEPSASRFSPPVIDFIISGVFIFFWFTSAIAIAASITGIKNATDLGDAISKIQACQAPSSCKFSNPKYTTLQISAVLGFLNVFLWCGNMWFLFKETPWHRPRGAPATVSGQQQPSQVARPAAAI